MSGTSLAGRGQGGFLFFQPRRPTRRVSRHTEVYYMMGARMMRGMGVVGLLVGLLAWGVYTMKSNPPGQARPFVVLETGDVLDVRTSLRWQQEPGSAIVTGAGASCNEGASCVWQEAKNYCKAVGNGFRLPKIRELISLMDTSVPSPGPFLPAGHPFQKVESAFYWAATANASSPTGFWDVFHGDDVPNRSKGGIFSVWCVR